MSSKKTKKRAKKVEASSGGGGLGLIGSMVGGFVTILIGISLMGTISQQIDNAFNCNSTIANITSTVDQPKGSTGSFGGAGGDYHFGGYDGKVVHKSFMSDFAIIKTDKSILNPSCEALPESAATMLSMVPLFFGFAILLAAIGIVWGALRNVGAL